MKNEILSLIQKELKAPKNQRNNFGRYNYRSCEDILEGLKVVLPKDCSIVLSDEIELIGDRHYVKSIATLETPHGSLSATGYARESETKKGMDLAQITGATSSYARKYALNGLFAIDDSKDVDSNEHREEVINTPVVEKPKSTSTAPAKASKEVVELKKTVEKSIKNAKTLDDVLLIEDYLEDNKSKLSEEQYNYLSNKVQGERKKLNQNSKKEKK